MDKQQQKLDQAARAAWLYYVGGLTQDEIAARLRVSRPGAQRLVALAREEGLVKVRIDHPVARCMVLADQLHQRFKLSFCDVVPTDQTPEVTERHIAVAGAACLEDYVAREPAAVLALGTGRTLRSAVEAMSRLNQPQHRFVSLVGNMARDGSTNPFDAVVLLADKTGGQRFLLPAPPVADTVAEREQLLHQRLYQAVRQVANSAEAAFIGIGVMGRQAPIFQDGFITAADMAELQRQGAVGELVGWPLDRQGRLVTSSVTDRVTSVPLPNPPSRPLIAMAGGRAKAEAIAAALLGGWLTGLVTDEATAQQVLDRT
ncbi:MAG: sugar-binding transcriptional regulator [Candidatus Competibacteraceae bacterium]|nr:sugar-binding transcriptional regulator [Candidatus Competibacteraceae bacterium]